MVLVTAAIIFKEERVLIARRSSGSKLPLVWEFPGGKVEEGETPQECLQRELLEELGIKVTVGDFLGKSNYSYPHGQIELLAYYVTWEEGNIKLTSHDYVAWVSLDEIKEYDMAPADMPIVNILLANAK